MFVGDEVLLEVSFGVARARLAQLSEGSALISTSEGAYAVGAAGLARVGVASLFRLVRVQLLELAWTDRSAGLAIRWEATGPGGRLFPVMDADLRLAPGATHGTVLSMAGVYRPPLGPLGQALDRAVLNRVAAATIRNFLTDVAIRITSQPSADAAARDGGGSCSAEAKALTA